MALKNYSFRVDSQASVTKEAITRYGPEAMISVVKEIRPKSLTQDAIYEVVVTVDEEKYESFLASTQKRPKPLINIEQITKEESLELRPLTSMDRNSNRASASVNYGAEYGLNYGAGPVQSNSMQAGSIVPGQAANSELINSLQQQLKALDKKINAMSGHLSNFVNLRWDEVRNMPIPAEFASIYKKAEAAGIHSTHLERIMFYTLEKMPQKLRANHQAIDRYFHTLLKNMIPCRIEAPLNSRRLMLFTGPTGVGKTTTIGKLAHRYSHETRKKVGIITLDTYRLGAANQMAELARILQLPVLDAYSPEQFLEHLKSLEHFDLILIDTSGNSQNDEERLGNLKDFLDSSKDQIDINLVLSAGCKYADLLSTYNSFSRFNIDTLVVTKFDETSTFGDIFSLVHEVGVPISFFSTGQKVPEDIMQADASFLAKCLLEGFYS